MEMFIVILGISGSERTGPSGLLQAVPAPRDREGLAEAGSKASPRAPASLNRGTPDGTQERGKGNPSGISHALWVWERRKGKGEGGDHTGRGASPHLHL